jgi:hypothetical protein
MDGCLVMRTEAVDAGYLGLGCCFGGEHPIVLTVRVDVVVPIFGASNDDEHALISSCGDREDTPCLGCVQPTHCVRCCPVWVTRTSPSGLRAASIQQQSLILH